VEGQLRESLPVGAIEGLGRRLVRRLLEGERPSHLSGENHLADGEIEGRGELPVPSVVGWDRHDGPGSIAHQDVVGNPDGDALAVDGVDGVPPREDPGLLLLLLALHLAAGARPGHVLVHRGLVFGRGQGVDQGMLGSQHHVGGTEKGVRTGGEDPQFVGMPLHAEADLGPFTPADPVGLHLLDLLRPVQALEIVDQALGVFRDRIEPLRQVLLGHHAVAALAQTVLDLFIGQARAARGAPVDGGALLVGQPHLIELQERPLGPLVVVWRRRVHLAVPVVHGPHLAQLALHVGHRGPGVGLGMDLLLDRGVLGGKTKGIPSHGVQDAVALQGHVPAPDVREHIAPPMPDVKSLPGGIREHVQAEILGPSRLAGRPVKAFLLPRGAPACFDLFGVVQHEDRRLGLGFRRPAVPRQTRKTYLQGIQVRALGPLPTARRPNWRPSFRSRTETSPVS